MATYAIGDVQGCFLALQKLLALIQFDPKEDTLWLTGDIVNRGPQSLAVLRFLYQLGDKHKIVLGNHDLALLAIAYGVMHAQRQDTLTEILEAPDCQELIDWLRHRPLLLDDQTLDYVMTHAGLAPAWTRAQACTLAEEVATTLRSRAPEPFLQEMFGNEPSQWDPQLTGNERLRCITNYLTRMRFCYPDGRLDLSYKGEITGKPSGLLPWFEVPHRHNAEVKIVFGHWAALNGKTTVPHLYALDTGCVWGNCLTAMRLEDEVRFSVPCFSPSTL